MVEPAYERLVVALQNVIKLLGGCMIVSPKSIKGELDKVVVGQEHAKETLAILAFNHYARYLRSLRNTEKSSPPRLTGLITGETGQGKTLLVETLARILDIPWIRIDATQLVKHGFSGTDVSDFFKDLFTKYKKTEYEEKLEYSLIYIDEVDKLCGKVGTNNSDDWNKEIQYSLLTYVDGYQIKADGFNIDTHKMLFIFSGAFDLVLKKRSDNPKGNMIGFLTDHKKHNLELKSPITRKEMDDAGIIKELIGRISVVTFVNRLNKEEIRKVVMSCENAIFTQYQVLFEMSNMPLTITEEDLDKIVEKVYTQDYGMRLIKQVIYDLYKDRIFDLELLIPKSVLEPDDESEPNQDSFPIDYQV